MHITPWRHGHRHEHRNRSNNMKKIFILHSVAWLSRWTVISLYFHWFPARNGRYCFEHRMHGENEANVVQSFTCVKFIVFPSLRLLLMVIGYPSIEYWIYTNNHTIWICNKVWANLLHVWRIFFYLFSICLPLKVLHWLVEILLTFRNPLVFSKVFFLLEFLSFMYTLMMAMVISDHIIPFDVLF